MYANGFKIFFRGEVPKEGIDINIINDKIGRFEARLNNTGVIIQGDSCIIAFDGICTTYIGSYMGWMKKESASIQSNARIWAVEARIFGINDTLANALSSVREGDGMIISPI